MRGRTITIRVKDRPGLEKRLEHDCKASAGPYPNITGMRNLYWGQDALIIKYGTCIYYMGKDRGQEVPY